MKIEIHVALIILSNLTLSGCKHACYLTEDDSSSHTFEALSNEFQSFLDAGRVYEKWSQIN